MYEEEQEERRRRSEQSMELEYNAAAQQKYGANDLSSPLRLKSSLRLYLITQTSSFCGDEQARLKIIRSINACSTSILAPYLVFNHAIPKSLP